MVETQETALVQEKGVELSTTAEKGDGIFATRPFMADETVMVGVVEKVLSGNSVHASQIGENTFVLFGGLISKMNHSCDPNCGIRLNETGGHDYIAVRAINANEELTLDYAMRNYTVEYCPPCRCGTLNCRGRITGWKDLLPERKQAYAGYIAPYLLTRVLPM